MKTNDVLVCDRQRMMDFTYGNVMTNKAGKITQLGDGMQKFADAAKEGKTVYLTVNGEIVSRLVTQDGGVVEEIWSGEPE